MQIIIFNSETVLLQDLCSKLELDMSNLPIYAPDYMNNLKLLLLNDKFWQASW